MVDDTTNGHRGTSKNKETRRKTRASAGPTIIRSEDPAVPPVIIYPTEARPSDERGGGEGFSEKDFRLVIQDLARQPLARYALLRRPQAKFFGIPVWLLDRLVQQARGGDDDPGQGRPVEFIDVEPWAEPVDGDSLLTELAATIRAHVVLDEDACDTAALWIIARYCYEHWDIFPRLGISSPAPDCGKSTLLDEIGLLVPRPLSTINTSAAVVYRVIEKSCPTFLIDEADQLFGSQDADDRDLLKTLNGGHKRGAQTLRCVENRRRLEARQFACFAPAVLAGIGLFEKMPRTLASRTLKVHLDRRREDEPIAELSLAPPDPKFARLSRQLARWIDDNRDQLQRPAMPAGVINRAADNWRPLVAVADRAGSSWGARARELARHAANRPRDDSRDTMIMLLTDIRAAFEKGGSDEISDLFAEGEGPRITSKALCEYLRGLLDRPWPEFGRARKPLNPRQLADILCPLEIRPGSVKINGKETKKGYYRSAFDDAFTRYLPDSAGTPAPT
jgi:hypothetical protein